MSLLKDVRIGETVLLNLDRRDKVCLTEKDRYVAIEIGIKKGEQIIRLVIDAPEEVGVEVLPPGGVKLAGQRA